MPEGLQSVRLKRLYSYYATLFHQAGGVPSRAELDPSAITASLPIVYLCNVARIGQETRFPFRLVGSSLVETFHQDSTGLYVRDMLLGGWEHHIRDAHLMVLEAGAPVLTVKQITLHTGRHFFAEHLAMPMRLEEAGIGMIFGGLELVRVEQRVLRMDLEQVDWSRDVEAVRVLDRRALGLLADVAGA